MSYDFIGCAKRLGTVLIGRTEPSVQAVSEVADSLVAKRDDAMISLRELYNSALNEPVPSEFDRLVASLGTERFYAAH